MLFYLIGIKGSALSALAVLLKEQGHIVRGVDIDKEFYTEKNLKEISIEPFAKMKLSPNYYYIIGNAYVHHSVTRYIKHCHFYYKVYPEFIKKYFKNNIFLAVSGSHGKTTTTKMVSTLIPEANYIIGDGSGSGKGKNIFLIEACEYRNTFLHYQPNISLILNIDYDHPDFFKNKEQYRKSFERFAKQSKIVIVNGDDLEIQKIKECRCITYGLNSENDVIFEYEFSKGHTVVRILGREFILPVLGKHYAYDFVGAYLMVKLLGYTDDDIEQKICRFILPKRRLQQKKVKDIVYIHDYAHHPTEIKSVYESVKLLYPMKKIVCIFQPHTITRSVALMEEFKDALKVFDETYILSIFTSVRENRNREVEDYIYSYWKYPLVSKERIIEMEKNKNMIYLLLGAGDIDTVFYDL